MKEYVFRDPVHGNISVTDPTVFALIQSPEFQRLRRIRQLGTSFISYPGAEHTRFAHSLGVYHLMNRVLKHLTDHAIVQLDPEEHALACCAALLHDIGHGPFSHLFEKLTGQHHETWVERVIGSPETGIYQLLAGRNQDWPARITSIIAGTWDGAPFLKELISSQLDVDRMDYLLRDSRMCGVTYGQFDLDRLIQTTTVVDGHVVLTDKGIHSAEEFLLARYFMYWNVYFHKATRSIETVLDKMFERAVQLVRSGRREDIGFLPPSLEPILAGRAMTLAEYLQLDETDVIYAIKRWTQATDPILRDLSDRFINRRLFSGLRLDERLGRVLERQEDIVAAVRSAGFEEPQYYYHIDKTSNLAYSYYVKPTEGGSPPLQVLVDWTRPAALREVTTMSDVLKSIASERVTRYVLFVPKEAADAVDQILED
ncbi:MAG TPA: HD domain-containing protein [Symbiobacteriaceae bacterium]|nr:HD domain-containing protein [Symbiobacteriaceae bacterium]